jgi:hypothetical protein
MRAVSGIIAFLAGMEHSYSPGWIKGLVKEPTRQEQMNLRHAQQRHFFKLALYTHQEVMRQNAAGHVVMPSSPGADFIIAPAQALLALCKAGFNRPAHPAQADAGGLRGMSRSIESVSFHFPIGGATQH